MQTDVAHIRKPNVLKPLVESPGQHAVPGALGDYEMVTQGGVPT